MCPVGTSFRFHDHSPSQMQEGRRATPRTFDHSGSHKAAADERSDGCASEGLSCEQANRFCSTGEALSTDEMRAWRRYCRSASPVHSTALSVKEVLEGFYPGHLDTTSLNGTRLNFVGSGFYERGAR